MDGRCATCKWWDQKSDDDGLCRLAETIESHKSHPQSKSYTAPWFYGKRPESVRGYLVTTPDFGCTQYEAKQP